jgi:hypothetical protein
MLRSGVRVFRNPKALRAYGLDGPSADYNGISSSSQQSHDKAVRWVGTTDGCAAGLTLNLVADDPVESGNEIRDDKGPLSGWCTKMQIPIVQFSQTLRERRFHVFLVGINESTYEPHFAVLKQRARGGIGAPVDHEAKLLDAKLSDCRSHA